jgi:hypothetical protein
MAAFTEEDLAYLRTKLGSSVNEETNPDFVDTLQEIYDRVGTLQLTVVEVLRTRLATIADPLANPLNYTIVGEYSQDGSANVAFLKAALAQAEEDAGVPGGSTLTAVPPGPNRWGRQIDCARRWGR